MKAFIPSFSLFKKITFLIFISICMFLTTYAQPGNCLNFDGFDDYVTIGSPTGIYSAGSSYTKEAWVLFSGSNGLDVENIISSKDAFWIEGGKIHAGNNFNGITPDLDDPGFFTINHWEHVALTYDAGTSTMKLYRNAVLVASTNSAQASVSGQNFIGRYDDASANFYSWKGNMDEVKIYNTALTQAQIQSDMVGTNISMPANIVGYYNFNSGTAGAANGGITTLADNSLAALNPGTLSNFVLNGATGNWVESYALVVPAATTASGINSTGFNANWSASAIGTINNYIVDVSTTSDFTTPIAGSPFTIAFGTNTLALTGLTASTVYYYRVSADKTSVTGQGAFSNSISVTTLSPLPISLFSFNVTKGIGVNQLQWSTSTELSSKLFEVQRSTDGINFTVLSVLNSAGNSNSIKSYQFNDNTANITAIHYYYRLKMVDINGNFKYSDIVLIKTSRVVDVTLYPNPSQDKVILNITDKALLKTTVSLSDINGKLLQNVVINQTATTINISNYSTGIYILRFINGQSVKLIKE